MSETASTRGGIGCITSLALSIIIIGGLATAWFWSQGSDPRQAAHDGIVLGAQVTTLPCLICAALSVLFVVGALVLAFFKELRLGRRR